MRYVDARSRRFCLPPEQAPPLHGPGRMITSSLRGWKEKAVKRVFPHPACSSRGKRILPKCPFPSRTACGQGEAVPCARRWKEGRAAYDPHKTAAWSPIRCRRRISRRLPHSFFPQRGAMSRERGARAVEGRRRLRPAGERPAARRQNKGVPRCSCRNRGRAAKGGLRPRPP